MNTLRNRFLGTSASMPAPPDKPAGEGKPTVLNEDVGGEDDQGAGGATDQNQQQDGGSDGAGEGGEGDGEGDGEGGATVEDDEDPDLADLPPEVREKAKKAIEKRLAKETGWRDRQIDRLHRQKREAREDVRATGTIIERQQQGQQPGQKPALTEADVERLAQQKVAQDRYDEGCSDTDKSGRSYFGTAGWNERTGKLAKMGGVSLDDMAAILATDHPAMVIAQLADDPDEFDRVMGLPAARRNNAFVKLGLKEPPRQNKAGERESLRPGDGPAPPRRLQNSGSRVAGQSVDLYKEGVDDDKWYEERNKQRRKKFSAAQ